MIPNTRSTDEAAALRNFQHDSVLTISVEAKVSTERGHSDLTTSKVMAIAAQTDSLSLNDKSVKPKLKAIHLPFFSVGLQKKTESSTKELTKEDRQRLVALLKHVKLHDSLKDRMKRFIELEGRSPLTTTEIEQLTPSLRANLLTWCQQNKEAYSCLSSVIATIDAVQKEIKTTNLIFAICSKENRPFLDGMCLNNELLINSTELFIAIHKTLKSETLPNRQREALFDFCIRWLGENRETIWLRKTIGILEEIAQFNDGLKKILLVERQKACHERVTTTMFTQKIVEEVQRNETAKTYIYDIDAILNNLHEENVQTSDTYCTIRETAEAIADDIHNFQLQMVRDLRAKYFVPKWPEPPQPLASWKLFYKVLTDYIADKILTRSTPRERSQIIKFFLFVCEALFDRGDCCSAIEVYGGLTNVSISRLSKTFSALKEDEIAANLHAKFSDLFSPNYGFHQLRQKQDKMQEQNLHFIPFIGILEKNLASLNDGTKAWIEEKGKDPRFNFEKIMGFVNLCKSTLDPISAWEATIEPQIRKSNVILSCFKAYSEETETDGEEKRFQRSQELEPLALNK